MIPNDDIDLDERLFERQLDPPDTTDDDEARADEWDDFND